MVKITLPSIKIFNKKTGIIEPACIYLDRNLKNALDSLVYNVKDDWDFVIIITGDRSVRTGKSVLAMCICAYLADKLGTPYTLDNLYFSSRNMIDDVLKKPKYSVCHYDEGREGLATSKLMTPLQHDLLDYFAECGQLNHIFVIVLPDFFGLVEEISVARSEFLINVYRKEKKIMKDLYNTGEQIPLVEFERGYFEFFNRYAKQDLYDKSRSLRKKNYNLVKANFIGRFTNYYPLPQSEYREKKRKYLKRFKERRQELKISKVDVFRDKEIMGMHSEGKDAVEIGNILKKEWAYEVTPQHIRRIIRKCINFPKKTGFERA